MQALKDDWIRKCYKESPYFGATNLQPNRLRVAFCPYDVPDPPSHRRSLEFPEYLEFHKHLSVFWGFPRVGVPLGVPMLRTTVFWIYIGVPQFRGITISAYIFVYIYIFSPKEAPVPE